MSNTFGFGPLDFGSLTGMSDGLDLMKRAWAPFNLPSNMTPTMDIDELDKRIADLKTVEQWLNMNLGMLRGTIQTMEIQRGTLAALQEMGRTFTGAAAFATPAGAGDATAQMLAAFGALQKTLGGFGRRQASEPAASAQAPSDPAPAAPGGWPGSTSARAQPHTAGSTTGATTGPGHRARRGVRGRRAGSRAGGPGRRGTAGRRLRGRAGRGTRRRRAPSDTGAARGTPGGRCRPARRCHEVPFGRVVGGRGQWRTVGVRARSAPRPQACATSCWWSHRSHCPRW